MNSSPSPMPWAIYFAVLGSVISVGLAIGLSMPLVSLRLEGWGYGSFAIGVMAASPALGILTGASLAGRLAARIGTPRLMRLCLISGAASLILLSLLPSYPLWLLLRLALGAILTLVFVLGESWMNQVITDRWRGRLVALYGSSYALSQLAGPLLLGVLGTEGDQGFWLGALLMLGGATLLLGRQGAPAAGGHTAAWRALLDFCRGAPAIAWAVALFACFEAMILTLLPVYALNQGFGQQLALYMVSAVVVGDALLQLPLGLLADRLSRQGLFLGCVLGLLAVSLALPLLVLFGATAGGLFTLALILVGERYRDAELVSANACIAQLWGLGCLVGPLVTGAASQWLTGHALPLLMAAGAAVLLVIVGRRGSAPATVAEAT